jgi:hypothetical protein
MKPNNDFSTLLRIKLSQLNTAILSFLCKYRDLYVTVALNQTLQLSLVLTYIKLIVKVIIVYLY